MLVTIIQAFDQGPKRWQPGENPDVDLQTARQWIAAGLATLDTDGQQSWPSTPLAALVSEAWISGLAANSTTAAATNTGLIQAALNKRGVAYIGEQGEFILGDTGAYPNSLLQAGSNSKIILGPNTTLRLANGISKAFVQGINIASTPVTVTNGLTCGALVGTGFMVVTADCGANAHGLVAGEYALQKGDTSRQYNGVIRVLSVLDPFRYTYLTMAKISLTPSTGTVTVRKADYNIEIGGGTWDYNGFNNPYVTGIRAHGFVFNNCGAVRFRNLNYFNGTKWMSSLGNCHGFMFEDIELHTASDGVHLTGNSVNGVISNIRGTSGDDFVALQGTVNEWNPVEDIEGGDQAGEFANIMIRDIMVQRTAENPVALYPAGSFGMRNVQVDGVTVSDSCKHGVYVASYTGDVVSNVAEVRIANVKLRTFTANAIRFGSNVTSFAVDQITIDGLEVTQPMAGSNMIAFNACQVARNINVRNVRGVQDISATRVMLGLVDGTTTVGGQINFDGIQLSTTGSGSSGKLIQIPNTNNNSFTVVYDNVRVTGLISAVENSGGTGTVRHIFKGWQGDYFLVSNSVQAVVEMVATAGVQLGTPGANAPFNLAGTSKTYIITINGADFGDATNFLACGTSSTYHLDVGKMRSVRSSGLPTSTMPAISYGTTNTFFFASAEPRFTIKTDTAGHTFTPRTGSIYNDTQAAAPGIYLKGPSAAAARIAT